MLRGTQPLICQDRIHDNHEKQHHAAGWSWQARLASEVATRQGGPACRNRAPIGLTSVTRSGPCPVRSSSAARGISMLQQTPPDANARSTEPPSSCGMRSRMMLTPYLQSGEATTAGPPISRHVIDRFPASSPGARFQFTSTRPCGADSAPYFAAFVTRAAPSPASGLPRP